MDRSLIPRKHVDGRWEFWIDLGGTFTDIVARRLGARRSRSIISPTCA